MIQSPIFCFYFLVSMSAVCRVRRLPSLYQAMAGGGTARLVTWGIAWLLLLSIMYRA